MKQGMTGKRKALLRVFDSVVIFSMVMQSAVPAIMFAQEVPATDASAQVAVVEAPAVKDSGVATPAAPAVPEVPAAPKEVAPVVTETVPAPVVVEPAVEPVALIVPAVEVPAVEPVVTEVPAPAIAPTDIPATPTVEAAGEASTERVLPTWNVDGSKATTSQTVTLGRTYAAPQNDSVTVTFTKLPERPGTLSIEEIKLSDAQVADLGAMSDKAYDITSDMADGSFSYDLTLPKPKDQADAQIRFAENVAGLTDADTVPAQDMKVKGDRLDATLDHFTIFIATYASNFRTDKSSYAGGETVYIKAGYLSNNRKYRIIVKDPTSTTEYVSPCSSRNDDGELKVSDPLAADAPTGTWKTGLIEYAGGSSDEGHHDEYYHHDDSDSHDGYSDDNGCSGKGTVKASDTFTVTAPDLVIAKTNDLGGRKATVGTAFHWILTVTNEGNGTATFPDHRSILQDNMPSGGVTPYGMFTIAKKGGTTGVVRCFQSGVFRRDLSCTADGTVTIPSGGSIAVTVSVDPDEAGTLVNPRAGRGNACVVDPDRTVPESDEKDNACADTVTVVPADTVAPTIAVSGAPEGWTGTGQTAGIDCFDAESGCDAATYRLRSYPTDPGACDASYETYALTAPLTVVSHEWICAVAKDVAGNVSVSSPVEFRVDPDIPTSAIATFGLPDGGSIVTNVWDGAVSGSASDAVSGVNRVELELSYGPFGSGTESYWNGAGWQADPVRFDATGTDAWSYRLPGTVADGTYHIASHAVDNAGNVENTYAVTIVYDSVAPNVMFSISPADPNGDNGWYVTHPVVTLSANDNDTVAMIEYRLTDSGTWQTYTGPVTLADGMWKFSYRGTDGAGNVGAVSQKDVKVDTKAPDEVSKLRASRDKDKGGVKLTWSANDEDIDQVYIYRGTNRHFAINHDSLIEKNDRRDDSYTDTDVKPGVKYYYKFVTRDEAGNRSGAKIVSVSVPEKGTEITVAYEGTEPAGGAVNDGSGAVAEPGNGTADGGVVEGASRELPARCADLLPLYVWILILIAYGATFVYGMRPKTVAYPWKGKAVATAILIGLWYFADTCGAYRWFPIAVVAIGAISYVAAFSLLKKRATVNVA